VQVLGKVTDDFALENGLGRGGFVRKGGKSAATKYAGMALL